MSHSSRNILEIFGFLIEICHLLQVQTSLTTAQHTTQLGSNIIALKIVCGVFQSVMFHVQNHMSNVLQLAQYFSRIPLRVLNSSVTFQMWVANFNFNYLSHFCINFENSCAHHQEEILTIPKHPQKSSF